MPGNGRRLGGELPPSMQKFLTVTEPDGTARTTQVQPSPLLGKIQAFLPQMAAANENLKQAEKCESAVELEKVSSEATKPGRNVNVEDDISVNMDLYVDESCGKLVGGTEDNSNQDGSANVLRKQNDAKGKLPPPLIQVLGDEKPGKP